MLWRRDSVLPFTVTDFRHGRASTRLGHRSVARVVAWGRSSGSPPRVTVRCFEPPLAALRNRTVTQCICVICDLCGERCHGGFEPYPCRDPSRRAVICPPRLAWGRRRAHRDRRAMHVSTSKKWTSGFRCASSSTGTHVRVGDAGQATGAGRVLLQPRDPQRQKAFAPQLHGGPGDAHLPGDVSIGDPGTGHRDDARTLHQSQRETPTPCLGGQDGPLVGRQHDRWGHSHADSIALER